MNPPPFQPDLDAYFARIGYTGSRAPTLATLNAISGHHVATIPFENLDVLLDKPIQLDPVSLQQKLIYSRRGGYCFEQNGFLLLVLSALGFQIAPLSARVRIQQPRDFLPARTHLFLRVELDGKSWLVDAGVGSMSLTAAIQLYDHSEQATPHETRRIIHEDGRWLHQAKLGGEWSDVCEFTLEEMPPIDRELANWWTSTSPNSKFRKNLVAARADLNGTRRSIRDRLFTVRRGATILDQRELNNGAELLDVLAGEFGLMFPSGTFFGQPGSPWPR